jgi:hypothetical protein
MSQVKKRNILANIDKKIEFNRSFSIMSKAKILEEKHIKKNIATDSIDEEQANTNVSTYLTTLFLNFSNTDLTVKRPKKMITKNMATP